jgi:hypothetical protein
MPDQPLTTPPTTPLSDSGQDQVITPLVTPAPAAIAPSPSGGTSAQENYNLLLPKQPVYTPLENIALAFSGGGFRAACFSIGTMSYLQALPLEEGNTLLDKVRYISSASGGSIASAVYAHSQAKGMTFAQYYAKMYAHLQGLDLLTEVFNVLNDDQPWKDNPSKIRNLINSFAISYQALLFEGATVETLRGAPDGAHLEEVCFNTSDFYAGLLFRQAIKLKPDAKADLDKKDFLFGNFMVYLDQQLAGNLRLGDLVAASSCFPAGFEPIVFPRDFQSSGPDLRTGLHVFAEELNIPELTELFGKTYSSVIPPTPVNVIDLSKNLEALALDQSFQMGLMDGGVMDNQGIDSMLRANDRRLKGTTAFKPFDLMLVTDVGSHFIDPYKVPDQLPQKTWWASLTVNKVLIIGWVFAIIGLITVVGAQWIDNNIASTLLIMLGTLLLGMGVGTVYLLYHLRRFIGFRVKHQGGLNLHKVFSDEILARLFQFFGNTRFDVIFPMLKGRINSILLLNMEMFLKRIRQLLYSRFFEDRDMSQRMKSNHIYDLSYSNELYFLQNNPVALAPGSALMNVAQAAFEMGTTLWFDSDDSEGNKMGAVIATGQFTVCANLLSYVQHFNASGDYTGLSPEYKSRMDKLLIDLQADYTKFKADPFWLYNQLGKALKGFKPLSAQDFPFPSSEFQDLR